MKKRFGLSTLSVIMVLLMVSGAFLAIVPSAAVADQDGDYIYTVSGGEATITGYTGIGGTITIPSILGGYPVVNIGDSAFWENDQLNSVTIPDTVTTLGTHAFAWCPQLTSVHLGSSVKTIGIWAFFYDTSLSSINIPDSVTTIEMAALANTHVTSITLGRGVTSIGDGVFYGCSYLSSITFLGRDAPTIAGANWTKNTPTGLLGHAYKVSNFPAPGSTFHGLMMGTAVPDVPYAPIGLSIIPGNTQVSLNWTAPSYDGGSAITGYNVYRSNSETGTYNLIAWSSSLTYTDVDLTNIQTYWYGVSAINALGEGPNCSVIRTIPGLPTSPSGLVAISGDQNVTISWNAPSSDGGFPLQFYSIYRKVDNGEANLLISSGFTSLRFIDNNVTPGISYSYYLMAFNQFGGSEPSKETTPTIAYSLVALTIESESSASSLGIINTLNGRISTVTGDQAIAGLNISIAYSVNNGQEWVTLPQATSSSEGRFTRSWIPPATGVFLIKATWAGNTQYPSAESTFSLAVTLSSDNNVFTVTSNSTISNLIFNSITKELSFTVSGVSGTSGHTQIVVGKSLVANGNDILISLDGANMSYVLSSTDTSWFLYFTYHHSSHEIVANLNDTSENDLPDVPTGLKAIIGNTQVTLNWTAPAYDGDSNITGYNIYRSTTGNGTYVLIISLSGLNYTDTNVDASHTYWYKISAVNDVGEGAQCYAVSVNIPEPDDVADNNMMLVIGAVIAIVAVLVAAVMVMRKRKSGK